MNINVNLSTREMEVAELLAWGACKKEVSKELEISVRTVENHARSIYEKTRVRSIGQLSAWWFCKTYNIPVKNVFASLVCLFTLFIAEIDSNADDKLRRMNSKVKTTKVARRYA